MKPAVLHPQALCDQQGEAGYDRKEAARVAVRVVKAPGAAPDQVELAPGIGSPVLGNRLGVPGFRTWQVAKFPSLRGYFERGDQLNVLRLLRERQDIVAILGAEFTAS